MAAGQEPYFDKSAASEVHSSMKWFVQARLFYAGLAAPMTERVLRLGPKRRF